MNKQERAAMQRALDALGVASNCIDWYYIPRGKTTLPEIDAAITALRAALAQEQEQKQKLLEAVRVRIMSTAYDCADDGEVEAYNSVKVLCTELLEMLK